MSEYFIFLICMVACGACVGRAAAEGDFVFGLIFVALGTVALFMHVLLIFG